MDPSWEKAKGFPSFVRINSFEKGPLVVLFGYGKNGILVALVSPEN